MYIDKLKNSTFFEDDAEQYMLNYLCSKGINNYDYINFFKKHGLGFFNDNILYINEDEYSIECFLGSSENSAYDIIKCNKIRDLDSTPVCAIAMLYGDDLICLSNRDLAVYFWDDNNLVKIADSFSEFIKKIQLV